VAAAYRLRELEPAEFWLLRRHRAHWAESRVLDLGVGAGRTTYTFGAVAGHYIGLDYLQEMVDLANASVPRDAHVSLMEGDARDLSHFPESSFDVVLFSCNGIDAVGHDDRLTILREVRRVLAPRGEFFFNVHNLNAYPRWSLDPRQATSPLRAMYYGWRRFAFARRVKREMRRTDLTAVRARGWGSLRDGAHDFAVRNFYIDPRLQATEIASAGLRLIAALDSNGEMLPSLEGVTSPSVWYLTGPAGQD
jgi:SAM-dependent methyltransferase